MCVEPNKSVKTAQKRIYAEQSVKCIFVRHEMLWTLTTNGNKWTLSSPGRFYFLLKFNAQSRGFDCAAVLHSIDAIANNFRRWWKKCLPNARMQMHCKNQSTKFLCENFLSIFVFMLTQTQCRWHSTLSVYFDESFFCARSKVMASNSESLLVVKLEKKKNISHYTSCWSRLSIDFITNGLCFSIIFLLFTT